jgi:protoheme ferro-lyase
MRYDAILIVSFGGPERTEDVIPFLENVLRGRNVPRERMLEVAEHYYHFNGSSPINQQCRDLIAALRERVALPVYWGNRNWHPMLADTVRQMAADGVRRALAIATSAYSSYSGCRQYIENIEAARAPRGPPLQRSTSSALLAARRFRRRQFRTCGRGPSAYPGGASLHRPPDLHGAQYPACHGHKLRV